MILISADSIKRLGETLDRILGNRLVAVLTILVLWGIIFLPGLARYGLWDPWEMDRAYLGRDLLNPARVLVLEKKTGSLPVTTALREAAKGHKVTVRGPRDYLKGNRSPNLLSALKELNRQVYDAVVIDLGLVFPSRAEGDSDERWIKRLAAPMRQLDKLAALNPQATIVVTSSNTQHDFKNLMSDMARARVFNAHQFLRYTIRFWEDNLKAGLPVPGVPFDVANSGHFPVRYQIWHRPEEKKPALSVITAATTHARFRVQYKHKQETYAVPVLNSYLIALSYKALGFKELAARVPFALFGLLGLFIVFFWLSSSINPRAGLFAALVLATIPHFFIQGRSAANEIPFIVSLAGLFATYMIPLRQVEVKRRYLAGFAVFALLIFASKGLMGLVLALSVLGSLVLISRDLRQVALAPLYGLAAFFGLMAVMVWVTDWSFFVHFRMTNRLFTEGPASAHRYFDYFIAQVGFGAMPWSAVFPFALGRMFTSFRETDKPTDRDKLYLLLLLWFGLSYLIFSFTFKDLNHFVFPGIIAGAMACGIFLDDIWEKGDRSVLVGIVVLIIAGILYKEIRKVPRPLLGFLAFDPPFQLPGKSAVMSHPLFPDSLKLSKLRYALPLVGLGFFLYYSRVFSFFRNKTATQITTGILIIGLTTFYAITLGVEFDANFGHYHGKRGRGLDASFVKRAFAYIEVVAGYTLAGFALMATIFHKKARWLLSRFTKSAGNIEILLIAQLLLITALALIAGQLGALKSQIHAPQEFWANYPGVSRFFAGAFRWGGVGLTALGGLVFAAGLMHYERSHRLFNWFGERLDRLIQLAGWSVAALGFVLAGNALNVYLFVARRISINPDGTPVDGPLTEKYYSVQKGLLNYIFTWQFWAAFLLIAVVITLWWLGRKATEKESGTSHLLLGSLLKVLAGGLMAWQAVLFGRAYVQMSIKEAGSNLTAGQLWGDVLLSPLSIAVAAVLCVVLLGLGLTLVSDRTSSLLNSTKRFSESGKVVQLGLAGLVLGLVSLIVATGIEFGFVYFKINRPRALPFNPWTTVLLRGDMLAMLSLAASPAVAYLLRDRSERIRGWLGDKPMPKVLGAVALLSTVTLLYYLGSVSWAARDLAIRQNFTHMPAPLVVIGQLLSSPAMVICSTALLIAVVMRLLPAQVRSLGQRVRWHHFWYASVGLFALTNLDVIITMVFGLGDTLDALVNEVSRKTLRANEAGLAPAQLEARLKEMLATRQAQTFKTILIGQFSLGAIMLAGIIGLLANYFWPRTSVDTDGERLPKDGSPLVRLLTMLNPFQLAERRRALPILVLVCGIAFALPLVLRFSKEFSYHVSQKHILETFKKSAGTNEVKGRLFKYGRFSRSGSIDTNFYTSEILSVTSDQIISGLSGDERKYYIVSRRDFSRLNYEYRQKSRKKSHIKVLDDRSFSYVLVSNKLKSGEPDRNWLNDLVMRVDQPIPEKNYQFFVNQYVRPRLRKLKRFTPGYAEFAIKASKTRDWAQLRKKGVKADTYVPVIIYLGYQSPTDVFSRKSQFKIKMYFLTVRSIFSSYKIFMHVDKVGGGGRLHFDHWILNLAKGKDAKCVGCFETRHWLTGDLVIDKFERDIPIGSPSGSRQMKVGFFLPKGPRLKILRSGHGATHAADNRLTIGTMSVR